MPEGDTVFLTARRLHDALAGRALLRGELRHPRLVGHDLAGRTVLEVRSAGKHLLTRFDDATTLHSHLRMDGSWHLYRPGQRWRGPANQVRAILEVPDRLAVGFRLHDLELLPTSAEHRVVGHLGPDLLSPGWTDLDEAEVLRRLRARPERTIGAGLLDQRVAAGVGNLYVNEVCFLLRVSPWTTVSDISEDVAREAVRLARRLLSANAMRPQQSTTGELARGAQHWVYERAGRPCRRCGTRIRSGGQADGNPQHEDRTTYFCPSCQPGPHPSPSEAGTAPSRAGPPRHRE